MLLEAFEGFFHRLSAVFVDFLAHDPHQPGLHLRILFDIREHHFKLNQVEPHETFSDTRVGRLKLERNKFFDLLSPLLHVRDPFHRLPPIVLVVSIIEGLFELLDLFALLVELFSLFGGFFDLLKRFLHVRLLFIELVHDAFLLRSPFI